MALVFEAVQEPPARGGRGSVVGATLYQPLVDAAHANPGQWFMIDCGEKKNTAYARAEALRKRYGLDAIARGAKVYVRLAPAAETQPI